MLLHSFFCYIYGCKNCNYAQESNGEIIMEDLVLSIPVSDSDFVRTLASRMGWTLRSRRTTVEKFIKSCPQASQMTDDEIQAEVNAVRGK